MENYKVQWKIIITNDKDKVLKLLTYRDAIEILILKEVVFSRDSLL